MRNCVCEILSFCDIT